MARIITMTINGAKAYLIKKKLFLKPAVSNLGLGNNYQVFLAEEDKKKYVLKIGRHDVVTENRLRHEFYILKFLREEGINFVQKPVYYDRKNKISVLTFAEGRETGVDRLNSKGLTKFTGQLFKLHGIRYKNYKDFCQKNKFRIEPPETLSRYIHIKGVKRFRYIKNHNPKEKYARWIEPRLDSLIKIATNKKYKPSDIIFNHCDLGGSNIVINKNKIYFIDWEQGKFVYNTDYWLGHLFSRLASPSEKLKSELIKKYSKYGTIEKTKLIEEINIRMKMTKIGGIIWAVKMYMEMKEKKFKNWQKYKKIADLRIEEYENIFENK